MFEKVLVFIGAPLDPRTEREWDALLEASGYQAFFAASEWADVDDIGCVMRAKAVRAHLKAYSDTNEAIYVDQPQRLTRYEDLAMPMLPMPETASKLLDALDAIFATA